MPINEISTLSFSLAALGAFLLGTSKSGVKGIAVFIVVLFVYAFGARASTGIIMPLLIVGDVFAIVYYNKHANWVYVLKIIPWMLIGVVLGTYGGTFFNEQAFTLSMAVLILVTSALMGYWEIRPLKKVPAHWSFAGSLGMLAGFTTMIGNLAGAVINIYFLALRLPKNIFIGTTAYVFFLVNLFKLPFHIWVWETIQWESIQISLYFIPFELLGLFFGVRLVTYIKDTHYRKLILVLTAIGSLALFFR